MQSNILITRMVLGPYEVNTYLVACPETGKAAVIDPAGEPEAILAAIKEEGLEVEYILNTHGHADHVLANVPLQAALKVPVLIHEADDAFFADQGVREQAQKELGLPPPGPADRRLKDNEVLTMGTLALTVLHTPGHTPGSVCLLAAGNLFTGDTLFVGDAGRTDLTGGSLDTLIASLRDKIIGLPPATVIWPGHDYGETPTSTVERERSENPYITDFILASD